MTASAVLPADQEVRDAVINHLETSFFLQAGAGTGKTRVLVDRVVESVRRGAKLNELVAITFTEKAAGELRDRIRRALHAAHAESSGREEERLRLAIEQVDGAHIETIHAFASSLLRERPLEAGLDPGFGVLDAVAEQLTADEAWENWLWEQGDGASRAAIERCLRLGLRLDDLRKLADQMTEYRDLAPPPAAPQPSSAAAIWRQWRVAADELCRLARAASPAAEESAARLFDRLAAMLPEDESLEADLVTLPIPSAPRARGNNQAMADFLTAWESFVAGHAAFAEDVRADALSDAILVFHEFVQDCAEARRAAGMLTFQDLLIGARDLLVRNARARRYFRARYSTFLVDEFQDTDPLQAEIIMLLAAEDETDDWRNARPAPGRLVVVGDPKQSIYRFRRADIDAYADVEDLFRREEQRDPRRTRIGVLSVNFRSRPEMVAWHNRVFETVIRKGAVYPNAQPEYQALIPYRQDEGPAVISLRANPGVEWRRINDARDAEAQAVARLVQAMVAGGHVRVQVTERRADSFAEPRPPRFRDICLLIRSRTELNRYTQALDQARVPYHVDSGRDFFVQQEVREAAALLSAIDDPSDEVALVAALKSAPYSASDLELLEFRRAGGFFRLENEALPPEEKYDGPLRPAVLQLLELRQALRDESLPAFVDRVLRETRLAELQLSRANGPQRAANLQLLSQRAADFAANEIDSLRPFVRWLGEQTRADLAEAESPVTEIDDDVVRILTYHQAKGLEFPIVILPKLASSPWSDRPVAVVDRAQGQIDFQIGLAEARFQSAGFAAGEAREAEYAAAEERRLFYVAATRARDWLVVPRFFTSRSPGTHAFLDEVTPGWLDPYGDPAMPGMISYRLEQLPHIQPEREPPPPLAAREFVGRWERRHAEAVEAGWPRVVAIAPSERGHDGIKIPRETEPPDRDADETDPEALGESGRAAESGEAGDSLLFAGIAGSAMVDGRLRGTAVHDALAIADFDDWEDTARRTQSVCVERGLRTQADEILANVKAAFDSDLLRRARAARRVERELPLVLIESSPDLTQIEEGYVDLLFQEPDGWVLLDYKSDREPTPATVAAYEAQVRAYVTMFRASGEQVKEAFLLFTRDGSSHAVPLEAPV